MTKRLGRSMVWPKGWGCRGSTCTYNNLESLLPGCGIGMKVEECKEVSTVHVGACHVEQMHADVSLSWLR